ncbi:MAG: inositol monophosphatase [Candidatus Adiutrix sp.]|nr:inositol monophosphatase [Candidatus Adiutrix sp.]
MKRFLKGRADAMINLQQALKTALEAAAAGAEEVMRGYGDEKPRVSRKGPTNLVTEYDLRSEEIVRKIITRDWPEHLLAGEEGGVSGSKRSLYKWHIDPLDGTANFAHGHPFFAVSIGLFGPDGNGAEKPLAGVINAPALGELYWGARGCGAFRRQSLAGRGFREKRLAVSSADALRDAMLNTGFPYDIYERGGEILHPFGRLATAARSVRRAGSAALDLAYVAAGVADAFWEAGLSPWDVAAGLLLLEEAGGLATDYHGGPYILGESRNILASNGPLHDKILPYLE